MQRVSCIQQEDIFTTQHQSPHGRCSTTAQEWFSHIEASNLLTGWPTFANCSSDVSPPTMEKIEQIAPNSFCDQILNPI